MATTIWLRQMVSIRDSLSFSSGSQLLDVFVHALTSILYHAALVLSLEAYECIFMQNMHNCIRTMLF